MKGMEEYGVMYRKASVACAGHGGMGCSRVCKREGGISFVLCKYCGLCMVRVTSRTIHTVYGARNIAALSRCGCARGQGI